MYTIISGMAWPHLCNIHAQATIRVPDNKTIRAHGMLLFGIAQHPLLPETAACYRSICQCLIALATSFFPSAIWCSYTATTNVHSFPIIEGVTPTIKSTGDCLKKIDTNFLFYYLMEAEANSLLENKYFLQLSLGP